MGVLYFSGWSPVCFLREEVLCVLGRGLQAGPVLSRRSTLSPLASASLHLVPRRSPPSRPRPRPVPRTAWPPTESAFVPRRAWGPSCKKQQPAGAAGPGVPPVSASAPSSRSPRLLPPLPWARLRPSVAFHPRAGLQGFLAARCGDSLGTSASANISRPPSPHWLPPLSPAVPHGVAPSVPLHGLTAHSLLASSMWAEPGPPLCGDCFARHGRPPGRRGGGLCSDPWLLSSPAACSRPVPSASSAPLLWSDCWTTVGFKSGSLFFPYLHTLLRDHIHFHGFKYRLHNNDF